MYNNNKLQMYIYHICISVMVIFSKCRLNINPSRYRGQNKKRGAHTPFQKALFCPHTFLCKDLEKAEFVGFSQIFSRNQEVIKGD
jgi:hypothetical protein